MCFGQGRFWTILRTTKVKPAQDVLLPLCEGDEAAPQSLCLCARTNANDMVYHRSSRFFKWCHWRARPSNSQFTSQGKSNFESNTIFLSGGPRSCQSSNSPHSCTNKCKLLGSIGFVFLHPKLVQDILKSCPESRAINLPDFAEGVPKLGWKSLRCSRGAGTERTRSVDKNGLDLANGELKGVRESILRLVWWPGRSTKTSLSDSLSDGMINPSLSSKASERRSAISSLWDRQLKKVRLSETKRQSAKSS